jgi:hypothetical protein
VRSSQSETGITTGRLTAPQFSFLFLPPAAMTAGWAIGAWKGAPIPVLAFFFTVLVFAWFGYMKVPFEFVYEAGDSVRFESVMRSDSVAFRDIKRINAGKWNNGFVTISHTDGSVKLLRKMSGLHDLISEIQRSSPTVVVRGGV